jgi:hypothetical protein
VTNLTLALDEDLVRRARRKAAERGTTLNAIVRDYLESLVGPSPAEEGIAMVLDLAAQSPFSVGERGIAWTRDELHDRSNLR